MTFLKIEKPLPREEAIRVLGVKPRTFREYVQKGKVSVMETEEGKLYFWESTHSESLRNKERKQKKRSFSSEETEKRINSPKENLSIEIPDITNDLEKYEDLNKFLMARERLPPANILENTFSPGKCTKILSLSDLHCPFQDKALIDNIIKEHADADIVVLNGDIIDAYGASSFAKDKVVNILHEYNEALGLIWKLSLLFPRIILVRGNHDQRIDRYFSNKIDPHMKVFAQKDVIYRLAQGYVYSYEGELIGQVKMPNVIYNPEGSPWIAKIGKTIFMHPHSYNGAIMGTVNKALSHVTGMVPWDSFDSVVIGHTHKVGKVVEKGKLLIEQGCLCSLADYQKVGLLIDRPTVQGYAVIFQDQEGNTLFNKSSFIYNGTFNYI